MTFQLVLSIMKNIVKNKKSQSINFIFEQVKNQEVKNSTLVTR